MLGKLMRALPVFLLCICMSVDAWDNDELEIFDLVEEVNQNFYTVLEIDKDASTSEVKKAYRKLSLSLHPDKNKAPDADVKFRQLVAIYEVIRDLSKRKRYDEILENGLPDWRQAVYYYRRVRKMGLAEMIVILFIIISIGQYCVAWAVHLEHKFNAEKYLSAKMKKQRKLKKAKGDGANEIENILSVIPTPSVKNTLPFQIPRFIWTTIISLPQLYRMIGEHLEEQRRRKEEEKILKEKEEEEEDSAEEIPRVRRRKGPFIPEYSGDGPEGANTSPIVNDHAASLAQARREMRLAQKSVSVQSSGLWTDDDIVELIRLVKKYPTGTIDRWEKIAEAMNRPVADVTHMAKKVKEDGYRVPGHDKESDEVQVDADSALMGKSRKMKTRGGKVNLADDITVAENERQGQNTSSVKDWTQLQQKKLEAGLLKYPKGSAQDRWEKIASCVPGKTKEECMLRFKYLCEKVRKEKREKDFSAQQGSEGTASNETAEDTLNRTDSEENQIESTEVSSTRSEDENDLESDEADSEASL